MSEKRYKRFYVSESENQLTIYDNEGLDDYYHLGNDERDVKGICDLLNELNKEFEDCEKLLDSKDDFIHKFKKDIEEQQAIINKQQDLIFSLKKDNQRLRNGLR